MAWYSARNGQQFGPFEEDQLKQMFADGRVLATDVVWKEGMAGWVTAQSAFPEAFPAALPAPPPPAPPPPPGAVPPPAPAWTAGQQGYPAPGSPQAYAPLPKQRIAYILLGVFLGVFGVHNYYAGYTGRGTAQLLLTLLSCFVLSPATWIWSIVEIIVIDRDAQGRPLI